MRQSKSNLTLTEVPVIQRKPLHADIANHLRDLILEGSLGDGDRIREAELCDRLAVSRTPLREAIKTLVHEGLVEHLPNRGARVAKVSAEEMRQLFHVISGLELLAVEAVTRTIKPRDLKQIRALHDRMLRHHEAGERRDYFALNHKIHLRLVELSGNPILIETHGGLMRRARHFRFQALADQARWDEAMAEHEAIMAALESGNPEGAGALMKAHVMRTGEIVAASIGRMSEQG